MPISINQKPGELFDISMGQGAIRQAPEALVRAYASAIAACAWSDIWISNIRVVHHLSRDNESANFSEHRSRKRQIDKLKDIPKGFDSSDIELFDFGIENLTGYHEQRDKLAHGIIGYTQIRPDHMLVFEAKDQRALYGSTFGNILNGMHFDDDVMKNAGKDFLDSGSMYSEQCFKNIIRATQQANDIGIALANLCSKRVHAKEAGRKKLRILIRKETLEITSD